MLKKIKGGGGKNPNTNGLGRGFFLASQPLVAHFEALESIQLGWMFPVILGDGAIILTYLYPDAIRCSRSHLWAETCRNEEGSGERLLCDGRHALVLAAPSRFCTYESSPPTRWDVSGGEAYKLLNSAVALEVITLCKQGQPLPMWKQYWRG